LIAPPFGNRSEKMDLYAPVTIRHRLLFNSPRWVRAEELARFMSSIKMAPELNRRKVRSEYLEELTDMIETWTVQQEATEIAYVDINDNAYRGSLGSVMSFLGSTETGRGTAVDGGDEGARISPTVKYAFERGADDIFRKIDRGRRVKTRAEWLVGVPRVARAQAQNQ
jgi:hypothetical protein